MSERSRASQLDYQLLQALKDIDQLPQQAVSRLRNLYRLAKLRPQEPYRMPRTYHPELRGRATDGTASVHDELLGREALAQEAIHNLKQVKQYLEWLISEREYHLPPGDSTSTRPEESDLHLSTKAEYATLLMELDDWAHAHPSITLALREAKPTEWFRSTDLAASAGIILHEIDLRPHLAYLVTLGFLRRSGRGYQLTKELDEYLRTAVEGGVEKSEATMRARAARWVRDNPALARGLYNTLVYPRFRLHQLVAEVEMIYSEVHQIVHWLVTEGMVKSYGAGFRVQPILREVLVRVFSSEGVSGG